MSGDQAAAARGRPDAATTGPPLLFLATAGACVLVGGGLLAIDTFTANVAGYLVASLLTILLVGLFRRVDLIRRLSAGYRPVAQVRRAITLLLVLAFVVAGVHVWAIATEVAS